MTQNNSPIKITEKTKQNVVTDYTKKDATVMIHAKTGQEQFHIENAINWCFRPHFHIVI